ncbi:tRNA lysidine(34) synthetase TilS [Devosia nitrariae]|uniref:tRNA(Ile)-lysidine synthase n=1 Tax=Devosia nitrariae TaxID=2071872 RepID=A0ABQ5WAX0_9HYPH|nr:tRNA lysidine(34) synthetase TilS [Devosia nitrariae]GLQ56791.1 tRNA(Ile)-lysidine synthase [Devosia nitrariae]
MSARVTPPLSDPTVFEELFAPVAGKAVLGLAISGGADSLALMLLAAHWASGRADRPRLIVYSVNHGLRPEAADEVRIVLAQAAKLGLPARGLAWRDGHPATGLQQAAREARYRLIGAAMAEDGAEMLMTAHHRNDQAETVLMRLAHGSGIEGLKGMEPFSLVAGVPIFRPLLEADPAELAGLVAQAGLTPVADPSNADTAYERVRWRALLPQLAEMGLDAPTLSRFAQRMGEADRALAGIADAAFESLVVLDGFGAARLDRTAFRALSPAIGARVLSRLLNIVGGRQKPRALGQVERLTQGLVAPEPVKATTMLGCVTRADEGAIIVAREPGRQTPPDLALVPGGEIIWDQRFRIRNVSPDTAFTAGVADYLPRHRLQDFLGFKVTAPAEALRTAPIVRDEAGGVLSLGGWSFDERIAVELLID